MSCRCRPNKLCTEHALAAQALERRKRMEALQAVQPPAPIVVTQKAEPEPEGPGTDTGYDYSRGAYRPGCGPRRKETW